MITLDSIRAQPFIEKTKIGKFDVYDIGSILDYFGAWIYKYRKTNSTFDLAALLTGYEAGMVDNGKIETSIAGVAYLKGACSNSNYDGNKYLGVSVSEDIGAHWDGTWTTAHELAHNLGAPHDGEKDASTCSFSEGHIMSYEGWGTLDKYSWSSCSMRLMRTFFQSKEAACLMKYALLDNYKI